MESDLATGGIEVTYNYVDKKLEVLADVPEPTVAPSTTEDSGDAPTPTIKVEADGETIGMMQVMGGEDNTAVDTPHVDLVPEDAKIYDKDDNPIEDQGPLGFADVTADPTVDEKQGGIKVEGIAQVGEEKPPLPSISSVKKLNVAGVITLATEQGIGYDEEISKKALTALIEATR